MVAGLRGQPVNRDLLRQVNRELRLAQLEPFDDVDELSAELLFIDRQAGMESLGLIREVAAGREAARRRQEEAEQQRQAEAARRREEAHRRLLSSFETVSAPEPETEGPSRPREQLLADLLDRRPGRSGLWGWFSREGWAAAFPLRGEAAGNERLQALAGACEGYVRTAFERALDEHDLEPPTEAELAEIHKAFVAPPETVDHKVVTWSPNG